jgi:hypothetical protein
MLSTPKYIKGVILGKSIIRAGIVRNITKKLRITEITKHDPNSHLLGFKKYEVIRGGEPTTLYTFRHRDKDNDDIRIIDTVCHDTHIHYKIDCIELGKKFPQCEVDDVIQHTFTVFDTQYVKIEKFIDRTSKYPPLDYSLDTPYTGDPMDPLFGYYEGTIMKKYGSLVDDVDLRTLFEKGLDMITARTGYDFGNFTETAEHNVIIMEYLKDQTLSFGKDFYDELPTVGIKLPKPVYPPYDRSTIIDHCS